MWTGEENEKDLKKTKLQVTTSIPLLTECYQADQIKEDKLGGACSTRETREKYV